MGFWVDAWMRIRPLPEERDAFDFPDLKTALASDAHGLRQASRCRYFESTTRSIRFFIKTRTIKQKAIKGRRLAWLGANFPKLTSYRATGCGRVPLAWG